MTVGSATSTPPTSTSVASSQPQPSAAVSTPAIPALLTTQAQPHAPLSPSTDSCSCAQA